MIDNPHEFGVVFWFLSFSLVSDMIDHHIPDLAKIQALPSQEIKFYAAVGAAISLAAGLELLFLDIFQTGTGLERDLALRIIYSNRNTSNQRDVALSVMSHKLKGTPNLTDWKGISERIVKATGNSGARNLVGHTAVTKTTQSTGGAIGSGPIGAAPIAASVLTDWYQVEQVRDKVLAGLQQPRKEDFNSLYTYCEELIALIKDVKAFLDRL